MKLNLGCGPDLRRGYVNVDIRDDVGADMVVDLNKLPWPWEDNSIDEIRAVDSLEHLAPLGQVRGQLNIIAVMGEIHRVLKPGGVVEIMAPSTDSPGAFQDPTHVTYWNRNTFLYFIHPSPYAGWLSPYPKFSIEDRECGLADSDIDEYGVMWAVARMQKLSAEQVEEINTKAVAQAGEAEPAVEGADFNG